MPSHRGSLTAQHRTFPFGQQEGCSTCSFVSSLYETSSSAFAHVPATAPDISDSVIASLFKTEESSHSIMGLIDFDFQHERLVALCASEVPPSPPRSFGPTTETNCDCSFLEARSLVIKRSDRIRNQNLIAKSHIENQTQLDPELLSIYTSFTLSTKSNRSTSRTIRLRLLQYLYGPEFEDCPMPPPLLHVNEAFVKFALLEVEAAVARDCTQRVSFDRFWFNSSRRSCFDSTCACQFQSQTYADFSEMRTLFTARVKAGLVREEQVRLLHYVYLSIVDVNRRAMHALRSRAITNVSLDRDFGKLMMQFLFKARSERLESLILRYLAEENVCVDLVEELASVNNLKSIYGVDQRNNWEVYRDILLDSVDY
ncbi:hypothetical protein BJ508DRAFT_379653 [Ascobolus immersus RN42]|uniref:Uncharacterized protein n=1 Tax=Ascobolus immersus RN42 TaxID=1160509 RepID=A0A3N4HQB8_ASCIM|nr:hypothetical protein BJ508DRAFT_379653 [Ascobolus immersus RN42]